MDQVRGSKNHTAVPVTDKPVLNASPFKYEYRTVVKSEPGEEKMPRFYEKDGFKRKPHYGLSSPL